MAAGKTKKAKGKAGKPGKDEGAGKAKKPELLGLAALLFELRELLKSPMENFDRIVDLLSRHRNLAEYEVARFYVSRNWTEPVRGLLQHEDPRQRLRGVSAVPLIFPRVLAASHLRRMVKDSDTAVRSMARAAVGRLGIADVAPPDRRAPVPKYPSPTVLGGWNPTGWTYGLFRDRFRYYRNKALPATTPVKHPVPALKTRGEVAKLVGLKVAELKALMRPGVGKGSPYVEFEIKKRSGGMRKISAPRKKLKAAQRAILDKVLSQVPVHDAVHGFVEDRSTLTNAKAHLGASVVVRVDIENFFPTVHYRRVLGFFSYFYPEEVATALAGLTTHRQKLADGTVVWPGVLPQGAPTSPALANLVCRRLDARLAALAKKMGAVYTRYADDLTFSFANHPEKLGRFLWWVNAILQQEGFWENVPKRRVMRKGGKQRVTGLVVDQKVGIPREDRRRFRAILNNCKHQGVESQARGRPNFGAWLRGYAAYVKMVHPELGTRWQADVETLLAKT